MDTDRFDAWTRRFHSRRTALASLLGGLVALGLDPAGAAAHNRVPACQKLTDPTQRQACLRRARKHNKQKHSCKPQPLAVTCAGRCGIWPNNCKRPTACFLCPPGRTCLGSGSCGQPCTFGSCTPPCGCSLPNTEGIAACIQTLPACPTQSCTRSADCPVGAQCQPCIAGGPTFCLPLCDS